MSVENLPLVGKMLGHRRHTTTANYAHLADDHLLAAADHVGTIIAEAMAAGVASKCRAGRPGSGSPRRPAPRRRRRFSSSKCHHQRCKC